MKRVGLALSALVACSTVLGKANEDETISAVMQDHYFLSLNCITYLKGLSPVDQSRLYDASMMTQVNGALRFIASRDSVLEDFHKQFRAKGLKFNTDLIKLRGDNSVNVPSIESYYDDEYSDEKANTAFATWREVKNQAGRKAEEKERINKFFYCQTALVAAGLGPGATFGERFRSFASTRTKTANIGYFSVTVDRAQYGRTVGTSNRYAEPKAWEGSRFFILHASFKNLDTESRMPAEGSLIVSYNGKEYDFDSVEPISAEGYNLWFRKVNPLVTVKTKIVYRIPNEIEGEVYWKPGRNPDGIRLWVGRIEADHG